MIYKLLLLSLTLFQINLFSLVEYDFVDDLKILEKNIISNIIKDHLVFEGVIESDSNIYYKSSGDLFFKIYIDHPSYPTRSTWCIGDPLQVSLSSDVNYPYILFNKNTIEQILAIDKDQKHLCHLEVISRNNQNFIIATLDDDTYWELDPNSDRSIKTWDYDDSIIVEKNPVSGQLYYRVFFNINKGECIKVKRIHTL